MGEPIFQGQEVLTLAPEDYTPTPSERQAQLSADAEDILQLLAGKQDGDIATVQTPDNSVSLTVANMRALARNGHQRPSTRLWWLLHLVDEAGGRVDASDGAANMIEAFCDDATPVDTFNSAERMGFLQVSHDTSFDTSTAYLTDAGRAYIEAEAEPLTWRCFHCGELFLDRDQAAHHFGTDWFCEDVGPACVQMLTEGEKAMVRETRRAVHLVRRAEDRAEQAEYVARCWEDIGRELTKAPVRSGADLRHAWEFLEGRALAAEAALNAGPRWLASLLRWNAERIGKRRMKGKR